jgi:glycosyltransferase involved in cell wall biosynthesis
MGVPCITTDIIGCNEIIINGENGEIIPPRDEKALYEKMKEWVDNPDKVAYMAKNARPLIEERYDQKLVWNALLEEYKRLTS